MQLNVSRIFTGALLIGLSASALQAQTTPRTGASLEVRPDAANIARIVSYWTPERRAAAVPRDMVLDPSTYSPDSSVAASAVSPQRTGAGAPPNPNAPLASFNEFELANLPEAARAKAAGTEERMTSALDFDASGFTYPYPFTRFNVLTDHYRAGSSRKKYPYTTIGKLFFTIGSSNYVCSASVARPHLLLTARHCIFDYPSRTWATNVIFYPGYFKGSNAELGGAWVARTMITWVSGAAGWQYDIGFIQLFNSARTGCASGTTIEEITGYLGYSYGGDYTKKQFNAFGYPQASPFVGDRQVEAQAATGALNALGEANTIEIGNDMTGGSSGGPWITTFNPNGAGSNNYANGLNSYKWISPSRSRAMNSPQFLVGNFYNLLTSAIGLPCP